MIELYMDILANYWAEYPYQSIVNAFPHQAISAYEGGLLYGLVRTLKPDRVLELGTSGGGSATVLASALTKNGTGKLTCLDYDPSVGRFIPDELRSRIEIKIMDIDQWLFNLTDDDLYGLIFEDAAHNEYQVHHIYQNVTRLLCPGGVILSHDAASEGVSVYVENGIAKGLADCGLENTSHLLRPDDRSWGMRIYQFEPV